MSPRLVQVGPQVPPTGLQRALEGARPAGPSQGLPGQAFRATQGGQFFVSSGGHFPMSLDTPVRTQGGWYYSTHPVPSSQKVSSDQRDRNRSTALDAR
jgi:hypothetical protein